MKSLFTVRRGVFAFVGLAVLLAGPAAWTADDAARREAAFQAFGAWLQSGGSPAEGAARARERRQALLELARTDPREALARALPLSVIRRLPPEVRALTEEYVDACGAGYDVAIGDDFSQADAPVSRVTRTLTVGDRTYEARVFGQRLGTTSKSIHANGIAIDGLVVLQESPLRRMDPEEAAGDAKVRASCASEETCIAVKVGAQTLVFPSEAALREHQAALEKDEATLGLQHPAGREEALAPPTDPQSLSAWTTGEKTVLYIRADFPDRPGDPVDAATVQATMDGAVDDYYQDSSYDKTSLVTTVTPTVRLPRTAADYEANGDSPILADAQAAARAIGFDSRNFNLFIVAFPRLSFGYSGKAFVGRAGVWLNGSFGSSVTVHELGHNYGVHHANWWQTTDGTVIGQGANVEYGNVFDVMGRGGVRGHFNAWFKTRFDWLLPAEYTTVTGSGGMFTIEPIDDPAATGQRALKIVKDSTRSYWVEFRQLYTTNRWAMNGALLNWGYNNNTGSHLLDYTPGSSNQQNDAALLVGRTFSDTAAGIHVTPVARAATPPSMDVVVKLGTFPGNTPPAASLSASATTVARNAPVTITATASDVNGDALAYGWEFDDGTLAPNLPAVTRSWTTAGTKLVRCIVSDMVGGTTTATVSITVTSTTTFTVSGTVTAAGQPLAGVLVSDGTRSATTGASGAYTIGGVPNGTYTLTPSLQGYTFTPATLQVTVNGSNLSGRNFTAAALPTNLILEAHFTSGTDGFAYLDDAFRATAQPAYASGARVASGGVSGGALRVAVGGVDDADVLGMSGGWRVTFDLAEAQAVSLSFAYKLTQSATYENDERSEMLAALDGALLGPGGVIAQLVGDGNGGSVRTTGFQTFQATLGTLAAGTHTLVIGAYNSQKTLADESTEALVDDVLVFRP
jgi:hypothetical protein